MGNEVYEALLAGLRRYGSTERDAIALFLRGVPREAFRACAVIAPSWEPSVFGWQGELLTDERGADRYLTDARVGAGDVFGRVCYPDEALCKALSLAASHACEEGGARCFAARVFSIDTIFAQFAHIDELRAFGANCVEMETSAAFEAARLAGIRLAALYSVSDNTLANKSLVSGRSEAENAYRKRVRREVMPRVLEAALFGGGYE